MDFFTDYFTGEELLASIAKAPYIPGRLNDPAIFTTRGLVGTKLVMEEQPLNDAGVLTATPRGTPGKAQTLEKRKVHTFETAHYRVDGSVSADEVLNFRAVGMSMAREVITARRDETIAKMRRDIDLTLETLRIGVLNAPTNAFGNAPAAAAIGFSVSDTEIRKKIFNNITQPLESALKGIPYSGIHAFCSDVFWESLIESKTVRETYLNQQAANSLRSQTTTETFSYGGVTWERYRGVGSTVITSGQAKIVPLGIPELFIQAFAPADTLDQIGAGVMGSPYYANAYPIDDGNRGWYLEMQTNPVMICTRPTAILSIDLS
jgi:hypothetical protein